jgi:hypothetical protein
LRCQGEARRPAAHDQDIHLPWKVFRAFRRLGCPRRGRKSRIAGSEAIKEELQLTPPFLQFRP